jgi:hypothetical protein
MGGFLAGMPYRGPCPPWYAPSTRPRATFNRFVWARSRPLYLHATHASFPRRLPTAFQGDTAHLLSRPTSILCTPYIRYRPSFSSISHLILTPPSQDTKSTAVTLGAGAFFFLPRLIFSAHPFLTQWKNRFYATTYGVPTSCDLTTVLRRIHAAMSPSYTYSMCFPAFLCLRATVSYVHTSSNAACNLFGL